MGAASAATIVWNGASSTNIATNGNWVGGVAPALTMAGDEASFTGASETNPATWGLGATNVIDGIMSGNSYAPTLTFSAGGSNRTVDLGATGIDTGSQLFTLLGTGTTSTRQITMQVNTNQTWSIGSGGLQVTNGTNGNFVFSGSATLTKSGVGDLTWGGGSSGLAGLAITSGSVLAASAGGQFVSNALPGIITLDGATALIRQNAALGNRTLVINSGGGTFQATNGNQNWTTSNQFSGSGNFTIDLSLLAASSGGLSISNSNTGYTGNLTIKSGLTADKITATNGSALGDGSSANHTVTINDSDSAGDSISIGNGINLTIGSLTGNANAVIATSAGAANVATLTVNEHSNTTYSGIFSRGATAGGTFNLTKNGSSTWTLSGNSLSTWDKGAVTLNAGTTQVAANQVFGSSVVTVALNAATLSSDVTGRSIGNTVTTGGATSGINPTGTFTLGALNAANGFTLQMDPGELLSITGLLTGSTASSGIILDLSSGFTTGSAVSVMSYGSSSGLDASDFALSSAAASLYSLSGIVFSGGNVEITLLTIPEPSIGKAWIVGGFLFFGLFNNRWNSRKKAVL